jgi:hypothetical protein
MQSLYDALFNNDEVTPKGSKPTESKPTGRDYFVNNVYYYIEQKANDKIKKEEDDVNDHFGVCYEKYTLIKKGDVNPVSDTDTPRISVPIHWKNSKQVSTLFCKKVGDFLKEEGWIKKEYKCKYTGDDDVYCSDYSNIDVDFKTSL